MDIKKILSLLSLLFGIAIIITAFILFRGALSDNILILNMVVSVIVFGLFFIDIIVPWVDFNDKSHSKVGSLGLRWFMTWFYAIAAIVAMISANVVYDLSFSTQLIVHLILFFFLSLGMIGVLYSSSGVKQVFEQETKNRSGVDEMKNAMHKLKDAMNELSNLPVGFIKRINRLDENMRFISPSNNKGVIESERLFIKTVGEITFAIMDFSSNKERIESNLKKLESISQTRKNSYSN